jgi:hypothetical protein
MPISPVVLLQVGDCATSSLLHVWVAVIAPSFDIVRRHCFEIESLLYALDGLLAKLNQATFYEVPSVIALPPFQQAIHLGVHPDSVSQILVDVDLIAISHGFSQLLKNISHSALRVLEWANSLKKIRKRGY